MRCERKATGLKALLKLAPNLIVLWPGGAPLAAGHDFQTGHDFQICDGPFALCAASTCTPTGRQITVNVTGSDKRAQFPEYQCTCPIFDGPAVADVTGGNMRGSCAAPQNQIWSLYSPQSHIPQAITAWKRNGPASLAPPLVCSADLNLGDKLVNCFSFACTPAGSIRGVPVATCFCPLGESLNGTKVQPHTAFVTQAGQRNQEICSEFPVAGPIPSIPALSP